MTEREWAASDDPAPMLRLLGVCPDKPPPWAEVTRLIRGVSDRKLRLWVAAMSGLSTHHYTCERLLSWRDGEEAPGDAPWELTLTAELWCDPEQDEPGDPPMALRAHLLRDVVGGPFRELHWRCGSCGWKNPAHYQSCSVLECGARSPWLTPDALSLAQAAWDDPLPGNLLRPDRLAVLSDTLEEAGCDSVELLRHLRSRAVCPHCEGAAFQLGEASDEETGELLDCPHCDDDGTVAVTHVRGCWAISLLLGQD